MYGTFRLHTYIRVYDVTFRWYGHVRPTSWSRTFFFDRVVQDAAENQRFFGGVDEIPSFHFWRMINRIFLRCRFPHIEHSNKTLPGLTTIEQHIFSFIHSFAYSSGDI